MEQVTVSDLIANPKQYQGKRVRVRGFCHLEFEGDGLYALSADYYQGVFKHGVWLTLTPEDRPARLELNDRYVMVEATFDSEPVSLFPGTLTAVTKMEPSVAP